MENNAATRKLMEKMFEATFRERFSQMTRKYGKKLVFHTWAQVVRSGGIKEYLSPYEWNSRMKITDALDYTDDYCDSVEAMIQDRAKKEEGKKHKALSIRARPGRNDLGFALKGDGRNGSALRN
jgi:hypothetical protein